MNPNGDAPNQRTTKGGHGDDGLSGEELARLAEVLLDGAGIRLKEDKRLLAETRLRQRARKLGLHSLRQYCDRVWSHQGAGEDSEREHLIDALTTHQTSFFRESHHFTFLTEEVLPAFGRRGITAWSAGCSTGEEAWTLAMVLAEHLEHVGYPDFEILATDVSAQALRHAATAVYAEDSVNGVEGGLLRKYLMRSRNRSRQLVRIVPELRGKVHFVRANLVAANPEIAPNADLVFCRNVMIYFDKPTQRLLLGRLVEALSPGGYLFLGHSEGVMGREWPLVQVGTTTYRKRPA